MLALQPVPPACMAAAQMHDQCLLLLQTNGYYSTNPAGHYPYNHCAPFDRNFHIILNMAIGGGWPGNPTPSTQFPQQMVVDWVRVTAI